MHRTELLTGAVVTFAAAVFLALAVTTERAGPAGGPPPVVGSDPVVVDLGPEPASRVTLGVSPPPGPGPAPASVRTVGRTLKEPRRTPTPVPR